MFEEKKIRKFVRETVNKILYGENDIDIIKIFKINEIPIKELREQYYDFSFVLSSSGYGGKFIAYNGDLLKEDAKSTLSINETKKEIYNKFKLKDWQFQTQMGANNIELIVLYPGIFQNTKLIKKSMEACGWSISTKGWVFIDNMLWRAISFDPVFQNNIANEVSKYKYLYHWTPLNLYNTIISIEGLKPRSDNKLFDYPNRLHLLKGNIPQDEIFNIGTQLYKVNKNSDGKYVLLRVNVSKIKDMEIFYDPRYEYGYYVKEPIQRDAIEPFFAYDFKNNKIIKI